MPLTRMRPVVDVALAVNRPHWTIRTWVNRGRVPYERRSGQLLVDVVAAYALSEQTPRRNRSRVSA